jgi:hypothetical protein
MSGTHRHGSHGKPRTARSGEPSLITRAARSLFSGIPAYGTITLVFLELVILTAQLGIGYVVVANVREQAETLREQRPAAQIVPVPGPTVTAYSPSKRGGGR